MGHGVSTADHMNGEDVILLLMHVINFLIAGSELFIPAIFILFNTHT